MNSKAFLSLVIACWFSALNYVQAQEPIIFKVKKPSSGIHISPPGDTLWLIGDNKICITTENNLKIAKVEVLGAEVKKEKNCYSIKFKIGEATIEINETTLSTYELMTDGSSKLILTKKYKIGYGLTESGYE